MNMMGNNSVSLIIDFWKAEKSCIPMKKTSYTFEISVTLSQLLFYKKGEVEILTREAMHITECLLLLAGIFVDFYSQYFGTSMV